MNQKFEQTSKAEDSGTCLPLSVLKKQGFNTKKIRKRCKDVRRHPILGKIYEIAFSSVATSTKQSRSAEQVVEKASSSGPDVGAAASTAASSSGETDPEPTPSDVVRTPANNERELRKIQSLASKLLTKIGAIVGPLQAPQRKMTALSLVHPCSDQGFFLFSMEELILSCSLDSS